MTEILLIFDETNSADVCLCSRGSTRILHVIARLYDAEYNRLRVIQ